jgi:hypothetical protein
LATSEYALENNGTDAAANRTPTRRTIYVRAIVDAEGVLRDGPDLLNDAKSSTRVSFDRGQMIVTSTAGTVDAVTGDITIDAQVGDTLRFFAKSGSNNFEYAVLLDRIVRDGDEDITGQLKSVNVSQILPAPVAKAEGDTANPAEQDFWFWQCAVVGEGRQSFSLIIALYDRDEEGQPRFAGLYRWDLQLTVQCSPPPEAITQKRERTS